MFKSTLISRVAFLVLSYFSVAATSAYAQQYATTVAGTPNHTFAPARAADGNLTTAATLTPTLVGAIFEPAAERVQFANTIQPSSGSTGLYMQVNKLLNPVLGNTIAASLFNSSAINTYLNGALVSTWSLGSLLQAQVMTEGTTATVAFTPAGPFNQVELVIAGTLSAYSVNFYESFGPAPAPLPVQLVSFQGRATAMGVQLSWQTATELNNSHFVVERAAASEAIAGEAATFVALGQVAGAGSSNQAHSYQFVDAAPNAVNYYRLRQVDATGQANYSPVVAVQAVQANALAAYPNPAVATLTVASITDTHIAIFDLQGRLLRQTALAAGPQPVDVSSLPAGSYFLRDADTGQRIRFEKAR